MDDLDDLDDLFNKLHASNTELVTTKKDLQEKIFYNANLRCELNQNRATLAELRDQAHDLKEERDRLKQERVGRERVVAKHKKQHEEAMLIMAKRKKWHEEEMLFTCKVIGLLQAQNIRMRAAQKIQTRWLRTVHRRYVSASIASIITPDENYRRGYKTGTTRGAEEEINNMGRWYRSQIDNLKDQVDEQRDEIESCTAKLAATCKLVRRQSSRRIRTRAAQKIQVWWLRTVHRIQMLWPRCQVKAQKGTIQKTEEQLFWMREHLRTQADIQAGRIEKVRTEAEASYRRGFKTGADQQGQQYRDEIAGVRRQLEHQTELAAYHCREKLALDTIRKTDRAEVVNLLAKVQLTEIAVTDKQTHIDLLRKELKESKKESDALVARLRKELGGICDKRFESQDTLLLQKQLKDVNTKLADLTNKAENLAHLKLRGLASRLVRLPQQEQELALALPLPLSLQPGSYVFNGPSREDVLNKCDLPDIPELPVLEEQSSWEDYVWTKDLEEMEEDVKSESSENSEDDAHARVVPVDA